VTLRELRIVVACKPEHSRTAREKLRGDRFAESARMASNYCRYGHYCRASLRGRHHGRRFDANATETDGFETSSKRKALAFVGFRSIRIKSLWT